MIAIVATLLAVVHGIDVRAVGAQGETRVRVDQLDNRFREVRVALPAGATRVVLERSAALPTYLDLVAVEQAGARVPLALPASLRTRDLSVEELAEPLSFELPAPAGQGATLVLAGRQELVAPSGTPFVLPAGPYPVRHGGVRYKLGSRKGRFAIDGKLDAALGAPLLRIPTHPSSGHPDGWATAWVRDDGTNLYAALDFASDDTDDHGDDYAEIWASLAGRAPRRYRVTTESRAHGAVGMEATPAARYTHKVYEFRVPLSELSARRGSELEVSFAAYGTASPDGEYDGCLSPDGLTYGYRMRRSNATVGELHLFSYDAGWSETATYAEDAGDIVSAISDPTCRDWLVSRQGRALLLRAQDDGGFATSDLSPIFPVYNGVAALSANAQQLVSYSGADAGFYSVQDDGGLTLETRVSGPFAGGHMSADGTLSAVTDVSHPPPYQLVESTRTGATWSAFTDAGPTGLNTTDPRFPRHQSLSPSGRFFAFCPATAGPPQLYAGDAGFAQVDAGLAAQPACRTVAVGSDGTLVFDQGSLLDEASPPGYAVTAIGDAGVGSFDSVRVSDDGGAVLAEHALRVLYLGSRDLTLLPGVAQPPQSAAAPPPGVPMLSIALRGNPTDLVELSSVALHLTGSLAAAATLVHLYQDLDQSGTVTSGDLELGTAQTPSVGTVTFSGLTLPVTGAADVFLLATVELPATTGAGTLNVGVTPSEAAAATATLAYSIKPAGAPFAGPTLTIAGGGVDAGHDAGVPAPDAGADAGHGGLPNSGCGCGSTGLDGWVLLAALGAALVARRASRTGPGFGA